jgi:hypothetical protein
MASVNILLNKPATASSFVSPFNANRANNGNSTDPTSRWVAKSSAWITVDAGAAFWTNRYVVRFMGNVGWTAQYNMPNFTFQASTDNQNWMNIDTVNGNTANVVDRTLNTFSARYFRMSFTSGAIVNPTLVSLVEFEVYDAPAPEGLSALAISSGTLNPAFANQTLNYTASVDTDVASVTLTPTASVAGATITVDGVAVASNSVSQEFNLTAGVARTIPIVVTTNNVPKNYNVVVIRQTSAYITGFQIKKGMGTLAYAPTFDRAYFGPYTLSVPATTTSANITISKEDPNATLVVTNNGTVITPSGGTTYPLNMPNAGAYTILIKNTSTSGDVKTYSLNIKRG